MIKTIQLLKVVLVIGLIISTSVGHSQSKWDKKKAKYRKNDDQGMSSDIHKKYVGSIVLSNTRVNKDNPDESSFKSSFKANEDLYGRIYMAYGAINEPMFEWYDDKKSKIEEPCDYGCKFAVVLERKGTDERKVIRCNDLGGDELEWTTIQVSLYPNPLEGDPEEPERDWVYWMRELPAGEHTFIMTYQVGEDVCGFDPRSNSGYAHLTDVMATTEFTIVKEEGMKIPFRMRFDRYEPVVDLTSMNNSILERAQMVSREAEWDMVYSKVTAIEDWEYERDVYGEAIRRTIDTRILGKNKEGNCAAFPFLIIQEHMGGGRYGQVKTAFQGLVGKQDLDCD